MIRLERHIVCGIRAAASAADLHPYLQKAVELEHSTIPPYLTALFSLKQGSNQRIAELMRSIVLQEMLHMCMAANILIAIGGRPVINRRAFIPRYPGPLPMCAGHGLQVGIEAFSPALVRKTFLANGEAAHGAPAEAPPPGGEAEREYATVGEFYAAIQSQLIKLGPSIFTHTTAPPQVVSAWFPADKLFAITGPGNACHAIDIILREGEGSTPLGQACAGAHIPFDPAGVWPLRPNCRIADFAIGTPARTHIERFAYHYGALLRALHDAFNGQPSRLDSAIGVMYDLRMVAEAMMQTEVGDGSGQTVGPSFEYIAEQESIPRPAVFASRGVARQPAYS